MIIAGDESLIEWVRVRMPDGVDSFGKAVSIGVVSDGKIIAGAVFYNYRNVDIELALAADSPKWATRNNINRMLHYPFFQLNCKRITTLQNPDNLRCIKSSEGLGFVYEGTLREAGNGGSDILIYGLTKTDYIKSKFYGYKIRAKSAGSCSNDTSAERC
jgi:RimJ/RimL family protein N-acetyltransferase